MADPTGLESRRLGLAAFDRGDIPTAARALSERIAVAPNDIEALCKLAVSLSRLGQHQQAIHTVEIAGRLAGGQPAVQFHRGIVLAGAGRAGEAISAFEFVTRMDPRNSDAAAWLRSLQAPAPLNTPIPSSTSPVSPPQRAPSPWPGYVARAILQVCWLLLVLLGYGSWQLTAKGLQIEREERQFQSPVSISYDKFVAKRPKQGWYRITGAALDVADATWLEPTEGAWRVFSIHVPVRRAGDQSGGPVHLLLATSRADIHQTVEGLARLERKGSAAEAEAFVKVNPARVWIEQDVEGVVQAGARLESVSNKQIEGLRKDLAPEYRVLDNERRVVGRGRATYWMGVAGLVLLVLILLGLFGAMWYSARANSNTAAASCGSRINAPLPALTRVWEDAGRGGRR